MSFRRNLLLVILFLLGKRNFSLSIYFSDFTDYEIASNYANRLQVAETLLNLGSWLAVVAPVFCNLKTLTKKYFKKHMC